MQIHGDLQISIEMMNMPQYGIECVIGRKDQMTSNHQSSTMQSWSPESIIESYPPIQDVPLG